jgi:hypothetical protein
VRRPRLFWILAGLLCLCTLGALLATAVRIREAKIEARRARDGDRITEPADAAPGPRELRIPRGSSLRYEDFTLAFLDGRLQVRDRKGRPVVEFTHLDRRGLRGWQELQIDLLAADPESLDLRAELRLGEPCRGPGIYRWLRPGLRIEAGPGAAFTLAAPDAVQPDGSSSPRPLPLDLNGWTVRADDDRGPVLRVEPAR